MIKANKGEWGEPYVALRLLGEGRIYIADENGNKRSNEWMTILDVIRTETEERIIKYHFDPSRTNIEIFINGSLISSMLAQEFLFMADRLCTEIREGKGSSFSVSNELMDFLENIAMEHIKAKSIDKSDIFISVSDPRTSIVRENIGFSIKTKFGKNPTLFNTAPASAVRVKLSSGMDDDLMLRINNMMDAKNHAAVTDRCIMIKNLCSGLEYAGFAQAKRAKCETFKDNLELINPHLPRVIYTLLYNHFFLGETSTDLSVLTEKLITENPCGLSRPVVQYPYMIKSFLYAAYCGMTASTHWDGQSQVNGGFISVDENGQVLAHYALESEEFKGYLFNNCYLEFPSTGKGHGEYGNVYKENDTYYFNLNFQIRYR